MVLEEEKEVTVLAILHAIKEKEKELEKELVSLIQPTRQEQGCITYDFHHSSEDPAIYMSYERWTDQKAVDEHLEMPYIKEFSKKSKSLLEGSAKVSYFKKIIN